MLVLFIACFDIIHRHTGGLEMFMKNNSFKIIIHRHTGGLENYYTMAK